MINEPEDESKSSEIMTIVKKQQITEETQLLKQDFHSIIQTSNAINRYSSLLAPIMLLTGHSSPILAARFNPEGNTIASSGFDKNIFLWTVFGECKNFAVLSGHKNAVLDMDWIKDGESVVSGAADGTLRAWDAEVGISIKKMNEHESFVNACICDKRNLHMIGSGGDDCKAKVWDVRVKRSTMTMTESYQITAVAFSDGGTHMYTAGIENVIRSWDLRKSQVVMSMFGHKDTITDIKVSPDGIYLLSNSMDNSLRIWDLRPYAPSNRCTKILTGHMHNYERNLIRCSWSQDAEYVAAGSSDRSVLVWDVSSRHLLYRLPGHNGSVNDVGFHPTEPIILSASSDQKMYLGEIAL